MTFGLLDSTQVVYKGRVQPSNPQPKADPNHAGGNTELKGRFTRHVVEYAIPADDLKAQTNPRWDRHGNIEAMLTAYDFDGKPLSLVVRSSISKWNRGGYDQVKTLGVQLRLEIDVPPEDFYLRTGIYDRGSGSADTFGIPLGTSTHASEPMK